MDRKIGFSLVEVLTAIAIICILSLVSYPALLTLKALTITRSAVEQIVTDLQRAKSEAIKANSYVVVHFTPKSYTIYIDNGAAGTANAGDWEQQEGEQTIITRAMPEGISLDNNFHYPESKLRFSGVAGIRPGSVTINGPGGISYKVVISKAGRLRTEKL